MTLKEAYEVQRQERLALQRENKKLRAKVEEFDSSTYVSAEKAEHLKQINKLTWENKHLSKECDRYKKLWHREIDINGIVSASRDKAVSETKAIARELDEYKVLYAKTQSRLDKLVARNESDVAKLNARIAELEDALARESARSVTDGSNSSIPTSQTPIDHKKRIPNSRIKTGRHKGGQIGHAKHMLIPFKGEDVTDTEEHELDCCPECGSTALEFTGKRTKDVIDFEVRVIKKRHNFHLYKCCSCGHAVHSPIPFNLKEPVQYGQNIQALSLSLLDIGFVSINRTQGFVNSFLGNRINISQGYLCNLQRRGAKNLNEFSEAVRKECIKLPVLHWDDTVIFENTKRACMRFYGNEIIALYKAHEKKDRESIDEDAVLGVLGPDTIVVHDHLTMNYNDDFHFTNAECIQHLQRDLQKITDITPHTWATELKNLISVTLHDRNLLVAAGRNGFESAYLQEFNNKLNGILDTADNELVGSQNRYYEAEETKLIRRLHKYRESYFLWVTDFRVPPTNNLSERSLRMHKTKQHVSGQYCSIKHAEFFANIRTYTETCSRNGISPFDALVRLMSGNPYSLSEVLHLDCE